MISYCRESSMGTVAMGGRSFSTPQATEPDPLLVVLPLHKESSKRLLLQAQGILRTQSHFTISRVTRLYMIPWLASEAPASVSREVPGHNN